MAVERNDYLSIDDFLALDRENLDQKYEYRNGKMIAMSGGSTNHTMLISNFGSLIQMELRKKRPCFALVEGTLKIEDACYLPDIMVTCDERDLTENKTYIEHPKLVIEVLSPSTERDNRREKFFIYTLCPSIQEYVLVNYDCPLVEKRTRRGIEWIDSWYGTGEIVELISIGLSILVDDIYESVTLDQVS